MKATILPYDGPKPHYAQLTGVPCEFAWLDPKKMKQLHLPVICKDYLQDAIWSEYNKKPCSIYGFSWQPGTMATDEKEYALSVELTKGYEKKAPNVLELLRKFDKACDFTPTRLLHDKKNDNLFAFVLDRRWIEQPVRISLLTLLIRVGTEYDNGSAEEYIRAVAASKKEVMYSYDRSMVQRSLDRILFVLKTGRWPNQDYKKMSAAEIHSNSGIVAMSTNERWPL